VWGKVQLRLGCLRLSACEDDASLSTGTNRSFHVKELKTKSLSFVHAVWPEIAYSTEHVMYALIDCARGFSDAPSQVEQSKQIQPDRRPL